ncbi:MAG: chemotaxis protein CheW [Rhodospirillales bacterium]|nr:chemotaxis protein CheW [Rhodospirillales bacterium]
MDDLLLEFLTETAENLAVLDAELVLFEHAPENAAILGNIFRLVHTIKGTCGFLGLSRLECIAHAGENVLGKFRAGELAVTPQAVTSILKCIDTIREMLAALEQTGAEPAGDDGPLLAELAAIVAGTQPALSSPSPRGAPPVEAPSFPVAPEMLKEIEDALAAGGQSVEHVAVDAAPPASRPSGPLSSGGALTTTPRAADAAPVETKALSVAQQSIRVPVETLESLMNLVSELVLTRNQLSQMVRGRADTEFATPLQRLSHITSELQEGVMKTRMQPVGTAWSKLPRIIRDLAHETGKKLDLQMEGEGTELDRQVLEMIKDPLTHMVRNAADHGIEPPDERRRVGKPEAGVIRLKARHEGGHIIIEVHDDGRGLDIERIRRKVLDQGLVREAELAQMSEQQIFQFVFNAGFSTAEKVTSVSGRGVGMDVVRTNIQKIGGSIELSSVAGHGSTFVIKIPLTLAIVSALIVAAGGLRFALPQICVLELVGVDGGGDARLEIIRETPLLRLRDRLLPLVDLRSLLQIDIAAEETGTRQAFVVVTQVGKLRFGIIVDEVFDTEEIVVKPINPMLRGIGYYAGNTILGDGGVVMILDPNGIAQKVGLRATQAEEDAAIEENAAAALCRLLLFRAGGAGQKAIPLELVARLEEIDLSTIEYSQGRPMIQYRGHLMPLIACDPDFQWPAEGRRPVLVFVDAGRSMGLVVDEIVDIAELQLSVELAGRSQGLVGSAVIDGKATELLDAAHFLTQAFPGWFEAASEHARGHDGHQARLLLVEDSPFFQRLVTPVLEAEGYEVTVVGDAGRALELYRCGACFDAVISDIELPGMSGFELAQHLRSDQRSASVPLLALSSHATDRDLAVGRSVGFTDYIAKFDRDGLMQSLARNLNEARG